MTELWLVGRKSGRTLYIHDGDHGDGRLVGLMDTPELAEVVCDAINKGFAIDRLVAEGPGEIPEQLQVIAWEAWEAASSDTAAEVLAVLAAVLPAHEAMVRAEAAGEVRQMADALRQAIGTADPDEAAATLTARAAELDLAATRIAGGEA